METKYIPNLYSGLHVSLYILTELTCYRAILFAVWNNRPAHKTVLCDVSPHSLVTLTGVPEGSAAMSISHLAKEYKMASALPCMYPCMLIDQKLCDFASLPSLTAKNFTFPISNEQCVFPYVLLFTHCFSHTGFGGMLKESAGGLHTHASRIHVEPQC